MARSDLRAGEPARVFQFIVAQMDIGRDGVRGEAQHQ